MGLEVGRPVEEILLPILIGNDGLKLSHVHDEKEVDLRKTLKAAESMLGGKTGKHVE